mgnify:CR=1 FL=1
MSDVYFYIVAYLALIAGVASHILLLRGERPLLERLAFWSGWIALSGTVIGLLVRGVQLGHWPLMADFEFALALIAAVLVFHLLLERRAKGREGLVSLFLALALATYFLWLAPATDRAVGTPMPFLRGPWFVLHTLTAALGYGAFVVAGGMGLAYLAKAWIPALAWLPELEDLDTASARAVRLGFPAMTLGIVTGGLWALATWAIFWAWDPKETWTLVVWLIYLFYLHARPLPRWAGKGTAIIAALGLAAVLFVFLGTRWLVRGEVAVGSVM